MYYHGIKQDSWIDEDKTVDVTNIAGSSKVTRTWRIFSFPVANTRGKEKMAEPSRTGAPTKDIAVEDPSTQEMEEIIKII